MQLTPRSTFALLIAAAAMSAGASSAMAVDALHWLNDSRSCTASISGNGAGSSWQQPTVSFENFQGAANMVATNGVESWMSHSTELSQMDGDSATFDGWAAGTVVAGIASNPLASEAVARFDVWFSISEPMEYHLSGEVSESGEASSSSVVRLVALNGTVVQEASSAADSARGFELSGVIQPGTYRIFAEAKGRGRTIPLQTFGHGDATCRLAFAVNPVPVAPPPPARPKMISSSVAPRRAE